ncbi:MAG: methyltransferase domain-containing protein [Deltaproteobacteria bacterium]|nr:methyltransferase domain-containing protein [Deltaproteobacteria bacterium]
MAELWSKEKLLELGAGFSRPRIFLTAAELDLFTKLRGGPYTVEQLCAPEGWNPRALRILLDALASMGLIQKAANDAYSVDETVARLLSHKGEETVLPMILHRTHLWRCWSALREIVITGKNPNVRPLEDRPQEDLESFIGAMQVVGRMVADRIANSLDLSAYRRLLDVGGGSGIYSVAFLKAGPHLTATLFDLPRVCKIAREFLAGSPVRDRIEIVEGDYLLDDLPKGHDVALLSAIIHSNAREENLRLYQKIHRCLEPGGTILLRDFFMDDSRTLPPEGAIFAVNMLAATAGGDSYTLSEVKEDLQRAGFRDARLIRDGERMDQIVSGMK